VESHDQLLRLPEVETVVALRRSAIYNLIAENRFPHPIKVAGRASRWSRRELSTWLEQRIAQRDAASSRPAVGRSNSESRRVRR
jgi:prophage regulatory protein